MEDKKKPDIRFKGFEEEWETTKLGEISYKVTEKNYSSKYEVVFTNSAELGIIDQREYFDRNIANSENLQGYYVVHTNDFVYNPRISTTAPVGPINRNKLNYNGVMSPLYFVFRITDDNTSYPYLEYFFKSTEWHEFMYLNGNSGADTSKARAYWEQKEGGKILPPKIKIKTSNFLSDFILKGGFDL